MIHLYSDIFGRFGGVETYFYALAKRLKADNIPFKAYACDPHNSVLLTELSGLGIPITRIPRVPGDSWRLSQRILAFILKHNLNAGDIVFCPRGPVTELFPDFVRMVHRKHARLAISWMLAPEFMIPDTLQKEDYIAAARETDIICSVSICTLQQFEKYHGTSRNVKLLRLHCDTVFDQAVPLPSAPPWRIGYMGRLDIRQKNLDTLLAAFAAAADRRNDIELHMYGGGEQSKVTQMTKELGITGKAFVHGEYDHRKDLLNIIRENHIFTYPSRKEGGPCLSLLELLQAGRYCVASNVGGIPDIYDNHPECGIMVAPDNKDLLTESLLGAVELAEYGKICGRDIRNRYFKEFDIETVHKEFRKVLGL